MNINCNKSNRTQLVKIFVTAALIPIGLIAVSVFHPASANITKPITEAQSKPPIVIPRKTIINPHGFIPNVNLKVFADGKLTTYSVPKDTVKNTLALLKLIHNENDMYNADDEAEIYDNQIITVKRVEERERSSQACVAYKTKIIKSDDMLKGEAEIVQLGKVGWAETRYRDTYVDGEIVISIPCGSTITDEPKDEIIKVGTRSIILNDVTPPNSKTDANDSNVPSSGLYTEQNTEENNGKSVLMKSEKDDSNFSLPTVKLSNEDRDLLERIITGEFGSSYVGSCLIAQAIKCAIVYDGYTDIASLIRGMGYVGSTDIGRTGNAVAAVNYIFDEDGLAIKHRLFYMCTEDYYNSEPGNFHSTQNFILQFENVLFFDRW